MYHKCILCDFCKNEINISNWNKHALQVVRPRSGSDESVIKNDFCSYECLKMWAESKAGENNG